MMNGKTLSVDRMTKKEIIELKKCIKEKDKRIKKIEGYFKLRNKLILTTIASLLCLSPYIFMFIYLEPLPMRIVYPLSLMVFAVIGVGGFVAGTVYSWFWSMTKIWEEG